LLKEDRLLIGVDEFYKLERKFVFDLLLVIKLHSVMFLWFIFILLVGLMTLNLLGYLMFGFNLFCYLFRFRLFFLFLLDLFGNPTNIKLYVFESSIVISLLDLSYNLKVLNDLV